MKDSSRLLAEAYATWATSVSQCCAPLTSRSHNKQEDHVANEKPKFAVLREQPAPFPEAWAGPANTHVSASYSPEQETVPRRSFASARNNFSVRKRFRSSTGPRRPQISAPTNFRHLQSESFHFPQYTYLQNVPAPPRPARPARPASFQPLELNIHVHSNSSPILADFAGLELLPPPPPAKTRGPRSDDGIELGHERSYSSLSFHLPRRATDLPSNLHHDSPPRIPIKSRARAYTAPTPSVEQMKERIASAMIEVEKLQEQIENVIERQSIYAASSRPSTAHSMVSPLFDLVPMPSIPALPPVAPSFAERLNPTASDRPQTAPPRQHVRSSSIVDAVNGFITPPPSPHPEEEDVPLAPPLPLVLRPPLRKKKSFSRVSTWLFPPPEYGPNSGPLNSHSSVTNLPQPVTGRDGFYQCVEPGARRASSDTVSTLSTWRTEDEEEARTVPTTTWSPGSSPATKQGETRASSVAAPLERAATFGKGAASSKRESVGVAF